MRFFISPWQCIPVRQPRGDIATHDVEGMANVAMKWGGEGKGRGGRGIGRKGSRDIFNYQPEVPTLPLPSTTRHQLPNISGVSLDGSRIHHPPASPFLTPSPFLRSPDVVVSIELLLTVMVSRLRYDFCIYFVSTNYLFEYFR